jgi:glycosyltransferase involved in cell wall biosynthesis
MRIFTVTPRAFLQHGMPDSHFFSRDMGLTCLALRRLGVESHVVMLHGPTTKPHPDIIRTEYEKMTNPSWWRSLQLDAVVLGSWANPKYTPVARAIRESGARLIIRCDSGSTYTPWQKTPWGAFYENHLGPRYRGAAAWRAFLYSMLKTPWHYWPPAYERKVHAHMAYADLVLLETPEGVRCLKARLCRFGQPELAARIVYAPHPVGFDVRYSGKMPKEKRIIAVGRWDNYQKNAPLLIKGLGRALSVANEYDAHLFGSGEEVLQALKRRLPPAIQQRIHVRGKVRNEDLQDEYQRSRILLMPSRSEGSSVAAEEALASGCSVVGSEHIFCMRNFVSKNSGTLMHAYTVQGVRRALFAEMRAWEDGLRDPNKISGAWRSEVSAEAVVEVITSFVRREGE